MQPIGASIMHIIMHNIEYAEEKFLLLTAYYFNKLAKNIGKPSTCYRMVGGRCSAWRNQFCGFILGHRD